MMKICSLIFFVLLIAVLHGDAASSSNAVFHNRGDDDSWISKFVDKVLHWIHSRGKKVGKQCFEKRKKQIVPSAAKGDSPLKMFGYPYFNEKVREAVIKAEVPLSDLFGFRQPIKIGARDYVFVGYPEEILAFCACFENYKVIGESLDDSGHWVTNSGTIKIQMENVRQIGSFGSSIFDMVFKYTLDRIMKYLNPVKVIKGVECKILGSCDAASTWQKLKVAILKIKKWLPGSDDFINKVIEIYKQKKPMDEKVKELISFMKEMEKRREAIRKQWIGYDNVERKDKKLIVTLTMYSKPEHGVRSTYMTGSSTITMKDVGEAIEVALDKK